MTAQQPTKSI